MSLIPTQFGFYLDVGLTQPIISITNGPGITSGATYLGFTIDINQLDSSATQKDDQVWFGSPDDVGKSVRDALNPGVTNISVTAVNTTGLLANPITRFYLATTEAGLDSAIAGAPLLMGTAIAGGVANAFTFWVRYKVNSNDPEFTCVETIYTNIILETEDLVLTTP